jgi:hypothetical protein
MWAFPLMGIESGDLPPRPGVSREVRAIITPIIGHESNQELLTSA